VLDAREKFQSDPHYMSLNRRARAEKQANVKGVCRKDDVNKRPHRTTGKPKGRPKSVATKVAEQAAAAGKPISKRTARAGSAKAGLTAAYQSKGTATQKPKQTKKRDPKPSCPWCKGKGSMGPNDHRVALQYHQQYVAEIFGQPGSGVEVKN
jgi:hypothetical protein